MDSADEEELRQLLQKQAALPQAKKRPAEVVKADKKNKKQRA